MIFCQLVVHLQHIFYSRNATRLEGVLAILSSTRAISIMTERCPWKAIELLYDLLYHKTTELAMNNDHY